MLDSLCGALELGHSWRSMSEAGQDFFLAEWIPDGFELGGSRNEYSWALSALQKVYPRLRLKTAWKVFDAWSSTVPVRQAPATPPELLRAMIVLALVLGRPQLSVAMLLAFCGLVRVREVLTLKVRDVFLDGATLVLCLGQTTRVMEQKVILKNLSVVMWFSNFISRCLPASPNDLLFTISYSSMLRWAKRLAYLFGGENSRLTTHAFRRSGASELSRQGLPLSEILLYGRWLSERAARDYIRKGEVAVWGSKGLISDQDWTRGERWGQLSSKAWQFYDGVVKLDVEPQHMQAVTVSKLASLEGSLFVV